jgi:hypothetical protein
MADHRKENPELACCGEGINVMNIISTYYTIAIRLLVAFVSWDRTNLPAAFGPEIGCFNGKQANLYPAD